MLVIISILNRPVLMYFFPLMSNSSISQDDNKFFSDEFLMSQTVPLMWTVGNLCKYILGSFNSSFLINTLFWVRVRALKCILMTRLLVQTDSPLRLWRAGQRWRTSACTRALRSWVSRRGCRPSTGSWGSRGSAGTAQVWADGRPAPAGLSHPCSPARRTAADLHLWPPTCTQLKGEAQETAKN